VTLHPPAIVGLLNVDKPAGVTSRDIVNRVQRGLRPLKVGHCGTLDPLATGVLVIAIGPATRLVEYVQRMPKTYRATFLLGRSSDTEDIEGSVVELPSAPIPAREQIQAALPQFLGTIQQVPPAYSALKVAGQRSYDLARRGKPADLQPRPVEIYALELIRYEYPELELRMRCGSGTYVRSLGRDLARALGTETVMSALRREAIGPFTAEAAIRLDDPTKTPLREQLLPPILALGEMLRIILTPDEHKRVGQGQSIVSRGGSPAGELAALNAAGELVAILGPDGRGNWKPTKNFAATSSSQMQ
jgi:tRNA pseudouridine55 synthase